MISVRKPPLWASVFTALSLMILVSLGVWQLQRLAWKEALIARMASERTKTAQDVRAEDLNASWDLRRGRVTGVLDYAHQIAIGPRTYNGTAGFHLLTPLRLENGQILMVNRGWIPDGKVAPETRLSGPVRLTGTFRVPWDENMFVPENKPEAGEWYRLDLSDMAGFLGVEKVLPVVLYLEEAPNRESFPVTEAITPQLNNRHLQYALFWFSMAGVLVAIYVARFVIRTT